MHATAQKLNALMRELKSSWYERDDAIFASVLALIAGEHICLVGDPGTGKSKLVRAIAGAMVDASYFEVLLSKTRPAERVLGPLDLLEFRENGNYFLKRKGFATDSQIINLEEIGKMSPVLGHDLLALLNERIYHEVNGGLSTHAAPLHTAFSSSNELPTNESEDAAAMWDRLLMRLVVDPIQDKRNFAKLLTTPVPDPTTTVPFEEVKAISTDVLPGIAVSPDTLKAIVALRFKLPEVDVQVSDRRWRASIKILQAAAFLDGSEVVKEAHLDALRFTLWSEFDDITKVDALVRSASNPYYDELERANQLLKEIESALRSRRGDTTALATYSTEAQVKLRSVRDNLDECMMRAGAETVPGLIPVADRHRRLVIRSYVECHDMDPDTAVVAAERSLGLGGGSVTVGMN